MCNATNWWRELDFARRQRLNVKGRKFGVWYNLEMFAIPPRGCDLFNQAVEPVSVECESSRALGISKPAVFLYMKYSTQSGTGLEREAVQKIAEVEHRVASLGMFLRSTRYGQNERLAYPWMLSGRESGGAYFTCCWVR